MKIILAGSGGWGKSWLKFIHETEGCELAALISRGGKSLEEAKRDWSIPEERCFTDVDAGMKAEADLVIITVPHKLHLEYAEKALKAGKHVLIEKPLCEEFGKALKFLKAVQGVDRKIWVSQNFRYRPQLWAMKKMLNQKELGELRWMDIHFRMAFGIDSNPDDGWRNDQWSMLMEEITIHHFDMARFLTGSNARSIVCEGFNPPWARSEGPECLSAVIEFENGVFANYTGSIKALGHHTGYQAQWLLQCDQGSAQWIGDDAEAKAHEGESSPLADPGYFPGFDRTGILKELIRGVAGQPCSVPEIQDNIYSFALVHAAKRSIIEKRKVYLEELFNTEDGV